MFDPDPRGVFPISPDDAAPWNEQRHGVFATVNAFRGPRRIENLAAVLAWAIDIDAGSKADQVARINRAPLIPSLVVETKNGHHVHWLAEPGTGVGTWSAIVSSRLVPFFGADKNARDVARILRVPGYLHWKNPEDPFPVEALWRHPVRYTEAQMLKHFPALVEESEPAAKHEVAVRESRRAGDSSSDDFWQAVYHLDCLEGLRRLSGHPAVGGEVYTFKRTRSGHNIVVDGKGTSCWVDSAGHIGSADGGGPTLAQWLRWFRLDWREVVAVLKELFPELEEVDRRGRR